MSQLGLILASTSPYRRELLSRLRLEFEVASPPFQETSVSGPGPVSATEATQLAQKNAAGKADSLAAQFPEHLVLGSDQVCYCEGRILGKPGSVEKAIEQLTWLAGKKHSLHTAVALFVPSNQKVIEECVVTDLTVRDLSEKEIRNYVEMERPLDSAGSYYSEGLGVTLFSQVSGPDPTAIVGLPLMTVSRLLRSAGIDSLCPPGTPS